MTYELLIKTISEIIENENISKDGLTLTYNLSPNVHKHLNEELFNKTSTVGVNLVLANEYEVEIAVLTF